MVMVMGEVSEIICAQQLNNRSGVWGGTSPLAPNPALGIKSAVGYSEILYLLIFAPR